MVTLLRNVLGPAHRDRCAAAAIGDVRGAVGRRLSDPRRPAHLPSGKTEARSRPAGAVDVVLPCLNEAGALPWVLTRIPAGCRAIVVDNGSTDGSAQVAAAHDAIVVEELQPGFGAACHAGLLAATSDLVAFMDADASLDPRDLLPMIATVQAGTADLVLGRRRPVARRAWPVHARLGNRLLAHQLRTRTGVHIKDLGPMRVSGRQSLLGLHLRDRRFGYPLEMVTAAAAAGWRITELDVDYRPRTGRSKVTGTPRGTLRAIHDMRNVLGNVPTAI